MIVSALIWRFYDFVLGGMGHGANERRHNFYKKMEKENSRTAEVLLMILPLEKSLGFVVTGLGSL